MTLTDEVRELQDALMNYVKTVCYKPDRVPPEAFSMLSAVSKVILEINEVSMKTSKIQARL